MLDVVYRRAGVEDAARLAAFAARSFTHTYEAYNTREDMQAYVASAYGVEPQTRELTDPGMITVIAESASSLIGYAQLRRKEFPPCVTQDEPIEIYRFYVDASAHGTGVAQGLMRETIAAARDAGARHVWLGVWEKNARAIAFYTKSGFRDVGTQVFKLGSDNQTDRVVLKQISSASVAETCEECGAMLEEGRTCRDYFHDLLALEWQVPGGPGHRGHFLAVSSYNLQHPSQFTAAMLKGLRRTFADVLAGRATIDDARARAREALEGPRRATRRPGEALEEIGPWPEQWPMTIRDVCNAPVSSYLEQVQKWAVAVDTALAEAQQGG